MVQVRDQGRPAADTEQVAESAGILMRVSSVGQDELNQLPELEDYCYDQNYRINRRYELHDKSAFHGEHEETLAAILEDIRAGVITVVVIVHSSRVDRRDPAIAEHYELSIRAASGRIESVREPTFGKADLVGRITTILAQHANHDYSKTLSGHVRAGHNRVRANRDAPGSRQGLFGRAPWGFEIHGDKYLKTLVPTPLGLKYVPGMFSRVIAGESLATVAAWLNTEGVPTGTKCGRDRDHKAVPGKVPTWSASTVAQIIRNTAYKGQMRDSNGTFVRECEGIVSAAVFSKAGKRLDASPTRRGPQDNANRAMLASLLWCECGSPVYRSRSETRVYYRCAGKVTGTSCFMVRLAKLDAAVNRIMSGNPLPVMAMTLIPGKNYDDELDLNLAQLRALDVDDPDYDGKHTALMAERTRLRQLDTIPDEWKLVPTGQTWGQLWDALEPSERGGWLAAQGFTVTACKTEVTVSQGELARSARLG